MFVNGLQVGIVSFGYGGCASSQYQDVYVNVAEYSEWIQAYADGEDCKPSEASGLPDSAGTETNGDDAVSDDDAAPSDFDSLLDCFTTVLDLVTTLLGGDAKGGANNDKDDNKGGDKNEENKNGITVGTILWGSDGRAGKEDEVLGANRTRDQAK